MLECVVASTILLSLTNDVNVAYRMHGDGTLPHHRNNLASLDMAAASRHASPSHSGFETAAVIVLLLAFLVLTFTLQLLTTHVKQTRRRNKVVRAKLFKRLGIVQDKAAPRRTVLGFFHPYCNAGGGGERVLWQAIEHHLRQDQQVVVVVYSGDVGFGEGLDVSEKQAGAESSGARLRDGEKSATKQDILKKCHARFGIPLHSPDLASRIHFLPLSNRILVSDRYWKRLTLLGQAYGSIRMAFEACNQLLPDMFIDTMGYAFAYPIVRLFDKRIPIGAYVHYPMISTDMLQRIKHRQAGHTNSSDVSRSRWRSQAKLVYYHLFAWAYSYALRTSNVLVANGTWTQNHLNSLILACSATPSHPRYVQTVYPPCDTASLVCFELQGRSKMQLVSLAQFRPEKEHAVQVKLIKEIIDRRSRAGQSVSGLELVCMGSCRNEGDERRVHELKRLATELGVQGHVTFVVSASYSDILAHLRTASIGLSTMVDEHFGINVVEFMAAGLITLSHASAGPLLDIAVNVDGKPTGFHANSLTGFADALEHVINLDDGEDQAIRARARSRAVDTFSNEAFCRAWQTHLWQRLAGDEERKRQ